MGYGNTDSSTSTSSAVARGTSTSGWRSAVGRWASDVAWSQELSGSLGDLGTFLPLVVALSATIKLDLGTTLLFSGLYNVVSGVGFQIPMCVQPMKTIAAVALSSSSLSLSEVMAAGLFVGAVMLLLGLTGAMDLASRAVPDSIVRGIQLAVGLQLAQKGITQVFKADPHTYRSLWGVEGCLLGLVAAAFLLITTLPAAAATANSTLQQQQDGDSSGGAEEQQSLLQQANRRHQQQQQQQQQQLDHSSSSSSSSHHTTSQAVTAAQSNEAGSNACGGCSSSTAAVPSALLLVLLGLILTVVSSPASLSHLRLGPSKPQLYLPTWQGLKDGALKAGLAQLPLTSLNSVIAVSHLAAQLFPDRLAAQGWRWRPGAVAVSVGVMNLAGCWFGAFPCCHGSGGLAAQYKFGARTGLAPVLLGGMKILLALLFGSSLLQLLQHFPQPLLGALLLLSGLELAASARKEDTQRGFTFMLLTAAAIMGLGNTAVGFGVGLGAVVVVAVYGVTAGVLCRLCQNRHQHRQWWRASSVKDDEDGVHGGHSSAV